jgi:2-oxoglutarate dehydrogenase E2 component (dihydrolipoamide succinyltransferase)
LKDQEIGEVESEKATLPLIAVESGKVELLASIGDSLKVGSIACKINTSVKVEEKKDTPKQEPEADKKTPDPVKETPKTESKSIPDSNKLNFVKITPVARKMKIE